MKFIGIDPGLHGAIAVYDQGNATLEVHDMPIQPVYVGGKRRSQLDMAELASLLKQWPLDVVATVERVHSMPAQGVASSFSFGMVYGAILQCLACGEVPTYLTTPQKWKGYFGLDSNKDSARGAAATLFSSHAKLFARKKDDGRAEAALLALYCRALARRDAGG
jgi:crossover junction endodeoxyribonuclease RuvC